MTIPKGAIGRHYKIACLLALFCLASLNAHAAFLYKSYIVRKDRGKDILCDPYIVQKNDWLLKIFRQRGEISHDDFPAFLRIFSRINPHVHDIDKILPGQHIFIPLKILRPDSLEGQELGVVTIPFVTISNIETMLKNNSKKHLVKKGDTVSTLLSSHFGKYGTKAYNEGLRIFKAMNPQIEDIDLVYAGQPVFLPQKALQNQPWYESLFDTSGNLVHPPNTETTQLAGSQALSGDELQTELNASVSALEQAAQILEARLFQKGVYYFPRPGRNDFQLNLTRYPVLEFDSKTRVLITPPAEENQGLSEAKLAAIKNYWKNLKVIPLSSSAPLETVLSSLIATSAHRDPNGRYVFNDQGVQVRIQSQWMIFQPQKKRNLGISILNEGEEKTPPPVLDYLISRGVLLKELSFDTKSPPRPQNIAAPGGVQILDASADPKIFIPAFFKILGMTYTPNVSITFPYAGTQIQAVSNLLSKPNGGVALIDFGDLYGDAVQSIEKTGISVVQIKREMPAKDIIPHLITAAGMACNIDPTFSAARRRGSFNISFTVPGYLAQQNETPKMLFATVPVPSSFLVFFHQQEIRVIGISGIRQSDNLKSDSTLLF